MQYVFPPVAVSLAGVATEATLLQVETNTANTSTKLTTTNNYLSSIDATLPGLATESTLSGVLTDGQLRATPVPVSGPVTDAQLRATAVPVSGPITDAQLRASAVPVSGPLTDTQLRATAVPVSLASAPLPSGAATEATLSAVQTAVDALNARLAGSLSPVEYDEQVISYVTSGNGIGEIFQIVYKLAMVTVLTVTLSYDGSNRLTGTAAT